jgi:hypothetical protein
MGQTTERVYWKSYSMNGWLWIVASVHLLFIDVKEVQGLCERSPPPPFLPLVTERV